MKEEKNCKIVQDLLPNFIEHLTNDETNKFIKEHLSTCEDCKKVYDNMKENLNTENNEKTNKKKVKFFKKYRNKLRILEIILLIIFLVFIVNTGRKVYIISELNNKAKEYTNSINYHRTILMLDGENYIKSESYCLGDKKKIEITTIREDGSKEVVKIFGIKIAENKYKENIYTEEENKKTVRLNVDGDIQIDPQEAFYGLNNKFTLLIYASLASINKTTFDGNECYYVSGPENIGPYKSMYVNKDTGLVISTMPFETEFIDSGKGRVPSTQYKFEFGTVTEDDFIEPDISEYKIIE